MLSICVGLGHETFSLSAVDRVVCCVVGEMVDAQVFCDCQVTGSATARSLLRGTWE
jgi:hypothetical protein